MKMITSVSLRKAHVHEWSLKGVGQIQGLIPLHLCMNSLQKFFGTTTQRKRDWADLCEVTFISGTALYNATLLVLHWASSQVTEAIFPFESWCEVEAVAMWGLRAVGICPVSCLLGFLDFIPSLET